MTSIFVWGLFVKFPLFSKSKTYNRILNICYFFYWKKPNSYKFNSVLLFVVEFSSAFGIMKLLLNYQEILTVSAKSVKCSNNYVQCIRDLNLYLKNYLFYF